MRLAKLLSLLVPGLLSRRKLIRLSVRDFLGLRIRVTRLPMLMSLVETASMGQVGFVAADFLGFSGGFLGFLVFLVF
jgi:hypothetical protein